MDAPTLLAELEDVCQRLSEVDWQDKDAVAQRRKACTMLRNLSLELEESGDLVDRIIYQPTDNVLIRLALDLNIFEILVKNPGPIGTKALAKETGADPTLLQRILRALTAIGAVGQFGPDEFVATKFSKAFTTQKGISGAKFSDYFAAPSWKELPKHLAEHEYRNPSDPRDTATQLAFRSKTHFFGLLQERPEILGAFATYMTVQKEGRPEGLEFLPVKERLLEGFAEHDANAVMFVDVGGGKGHEILELRKRLPELRGRMIVQDRPEVIAGISEQDRASMEVMEYDFFTPQPIKGARAYYFRNIFHDWSDENCAKILLQTTQAMTPAYSKILINELVIPDVNASLFTTRSDINMMAMLASMERSEQQWRELLGSVGLRIVKIWTAEIDSERIIECVLD